MTRKFLLLCGILASVLYTVANIVCAAGYPGYSSVSQTVSELSAIGAPTRTLWIAMAMLYSFLMIAFGAGILKSAGKQKNLRLIGILIIADSVIGMFWPSMHQREVLVAGGGTLTDTLHILFTFIHVPITMLVIGLGASAFNSGFRYYSIITLVALIVFGILTGMESPGVQNGQPTPFIGIWERLIIGLYLVWLVVLSLRLMREVSVGTRIPAGPLAH